MKRIIVAIALTLWSSTAFAQLGDILGGIQRNTGKLKKGAKVAQQATHEITEEEEFVIGRVIAARVLATFPLSTNHDLQKYVTLVGRTVAQYSSRPLLKWHFAVLQSDLVNAFSCPSGYIFITTGALNVIESEAELAAVLGHEIAHATQKHILKEVKRANLFTSGLEIASNQVGFGGLGEQALKKVGDYAIEKLLKTGIGRREELEADRVGQQIAAEAGYRANAMVTFLKKLEKLGSASSSMKQLTSTHPKSSDRIAALGAQPETGVVLAERWKKSAAKK